jgi:predicted permease
MRVFGRRPADGEIDEELQAHLEIAIQERMERGESPRQARRAALLELGNFGTVKEDARSVWVRRTLETLAQDLNYAFRRLRMSPGFTALAVMTLAFGLSVNATIFELISSMFLRPLPVKDADRLVLVLQRNPNSDFIGGLSWSDFQDYRMQIGEFSDMLALAFRPAHLSVNGLPADRTWIEGVSGNYFSMLGITPMTGRFFMPEEGRQPNADPVAVLGYDYWQTRLGGDLGIVGRAITINGHPLTVIGIAPESFSSAQWALAPGAFVPATMMPALFSDPTILERRDSGAFKVMAHLKPGVSAAQATSAVRLLGQRLTEEYRPDSKSQFFVRPERLTRPEPSTSQSLPVAAALFTALALLVLFTACANVANLMFSRAAARRNEISTRLAIGAGRGRLIRQLLTESILLAVLAGAVGMLMSEGAGTLLARLTAGTTGDIPVHPDARWSWLPVIATVLISIAAGVGTGVFPALRATKGDLLSMMKGGKTGVGRERQLFRSGLVLGQIGVSVVVLACAGLFVQSLMQLTASDLGFRSERLLMASVDLDLQGYEPDKGRQFLKQLAERVDALPGVASSAFGAYVPFDNSMANRAVALTDALGANDEQSLRIGINLVDPAYLATLGLTLTDGRWIAETDDASSPKVAVVNQTMAERLWPGEEAIGKSFRWQSGGEPVEVIGVTRNGKYHMLGEAPRPFAYLPLAQEYSGMATLHVRTETDDPLALAAALQEAAGYLDADLPVFNMRTMEEHLRASVFAFLPLRIAAILAGTQGAIALLLALMGVYGVVASSVTQRTRDIGIRVALGARKLDVFRLVSRSGLRPALIGLVLGLAVAVALARLLTAFLFGLDPVNVPVFAAVFAVVLGVSLFACWLPARRAARTDPMTALRHE